MPLALGPPHSLPNGHHMAALGPMTQTSMQLQATQYTQQFTQFTQHVSDLYLILMLAVDIAVFVETQGQVKVA